MAKYVFRCKECGSTHIQIRAWINPNTDEIIDDCEDKVCWCSVCDDMQCYECIEVEE
jgi:hypothetical protein